MKTGISGIKLIFLLLFMSPLNIVTKNAESPKKVQIKRSYADLLNSLIKVNQERVSALKKLYFLNSITYGKNLLRTTFENKLESYDKMQERLIQAVKHILDSLEQAQKVSNDDDLNKILQEHDYIFVLPIDKDNEEQLRYIIENHQESNKSENALRNNDSDDDDSKEKSDDQSDSKNDSKSTSSEKLNEESLNDVKGNGTQGRTLYNYGCGRGRLRCIRACKGAYREACDNYYCRSSLRSSLRSACKSECKSWFY